MSVPLLKTLQWLLPATGIGNSSAYRHQADAVGEGSRLGLTIHTCTMWVAEVLVKQTSLTPVTMIISKWMWTQMLIFLEKMESQVFMCNFSYLKYWLSWKTKIFGDQWVEGLWGTSLGPAAYRRKPRCSAQPDVVHVLTPYYCSTPSLATHQPPHYIHAELPAVSRMHHALLHILLALFEYSSPPTSPGYLILVLQDQIQHLLDWATFPENPPLPPSP